MFYTNYTSYKPYTSYKAYPAYFSYKPCITITISDLILYCLEFKLTITLPKKFTLKKILLSLQLKCKTIAFYGYIKHIQY